MVRNEIADLNQLHGLKKNEMKCGFPITVMASVSLVIREKKRYILQNQRNDRMGQWSMSTWVLSGFTGFRW